MKKYLIKNNGKLEIVFCEGFVPKDIVCEVSDPLINDPEVITVGEFTDEHGRTYKKPIINNVMKAEKEQASELAKQNDDKWVSDKNKLVKELKEFKKISSPTQQEKDDVLLSLVKYCIHALRDT